MDNLSLSSLLQDHRRFHSDLQMDCFVTAASGVGHPYGMYMQALRELHSRYGSLHEAYSDLEELDLDLDDLGDTPREVIKRRRLRLKREELVATITDMEREFSRFYAQAAVLRNELGDKLKDRDKLDREWWMHKLRANVATDLLREGRPSASTLALVQALPGSLRKMMWKAIDEPEHTVQWYRSLEPYQPQTDSHQRLLPANVRSLVCSPSLPS